MNYIIDPMWFYWLSVVEGIKIIAIIVAVLCGGGLFGGSIVWISNIEYGGDDKDVKIAKKIIKKCLIVGSIAALCLIFIPGKETLIEMQVARFATYENAEWTIETIKSAVDYIVKAAKAIK